MAKKYVAVLIVLVMIVVLLMSCNQGITEIKLSELRNDDKEYSLFDISYGSTPDEVCELLGIDDYELEPASETHEESKQITLAGYELCGENAYIVLSFYNNAYSGARILVETGDVPALYKEVSKELHSLYGAIWSFGGDENAPDLETWLGTRSSLSVMQSNRFSSDVKYIDGEFLELQVHAIEN